MTRASDARHEIFAREWMIDRNATRAYKAAGFKAKNDNVAAVEGHKLLNSPKVKQIIDALEREIHEKLEITKEKLEREIAAMAFVRLRDFLDEEGCMKPPAEWTEAMSAAVAQIEIFEEWQGKGADREYIGRVRKIKLWPKLEASLALGATHGIGVKRVEVGKPGEFDAQTREEKEKRVLEIAARRGLKLVSSSDK